MNLQYGKAFDNESLQWQFLRLQIADKYGWTLEYIDALPYADVMIMLGTWAGESEYLKSKRK